MRVAQAKAEVYEIVRDACRASLAVGDGGRSGGRSGANCGAESGAGISGGSSGARSGGSCGGSERDVSMENTGGDLARDLSTEDIEGGLERNLSREDSSGKLPTDVSREDTGGDLATDESRVDIGDDLAGVNPNLNSDMARDVSGGLFGYRPPRVNPNDAPGTEGGFAVADPGESREDTGGDLERDLSRKDTGGDLTRDLSGDLGLGFTLNPIEGGFAVAGTGESLPRWVELPEDPETGPRLAPGW